jgi:hypothetical protein
VAKLHPLALDSGIELRASDAEVAVADEVLPLVCKVLPILIVRHATDVDRSRHRSSRSEV